MDAYSNETFLQQAGPLCLEHYAYSSSICSDVCVVLCSDYNLSSIHTSVSGSWPDYWLLFSLWCDITWHCEQYTLWHLSWSYSLGSRRILLPVTFIFPYRCVFSLQLVTFSTFVFFGFDSVFGWSVTKIKAEVDLLQKVILLCFCKDC